MVDKKTCLDCSYWLVNSSYGEVVYRCKYLCRIIHPETPVSNMSMCLLHAPMLKFLLSMFSQGASVKDNFLLYSGGHFSLFAIVGSRFQRIQPMSEQYIARAGDILPGGKILAKFSRTWPNLPTVQY